MRKAVLTLFFLPFLLAATAGADESLPALFKQVKDEFSAGAFDKALAALDRLDTASSKPGFEADRTKLNPIIAFYRGAIYASMNRPAEARQAFATYLGYAPNATVDPARYAKPVVAAFNAAKADAAKPRSSVAVALAAFQPTADAIVRSDFVWSHTAVRYLLTDDEKKRWAAMQSNEERAAFVEEFWTRLDPTPGTPANELRKEFERRLLFADANFSVDGEVGRETDRANVLALMGPPTAVGLAPIAGPDGDMMNSGRVDGASLLAPVDINKSHREVWRYSKEKIPEVMRRQHAIIDFNFLTQDAIGKARMQKDSVPLHTLEVVADEINRTKRLP